MIGEAGIGGGRNGEAALSGGERCVCMCGGWRKEVWRLVGVTSSRIFCKYSPCALRCLFGEKSHCGLIHILRNHSSSASNKSYFHSSNEEHIQSLMAQVIQKPNTILRQGPRVVLTGVFKESVGVRNIPGQPFTECHAVRVVISSGCGFNLSSCGRGNCYITSGYPTSIL